MSHRAAPGAWSLVYVLACGIVAGCTVGGPGPAPTLDSCPQLWVADYRGNWEWIGVVGPPGTVAPHDIVTLSFEGEVLTQTYANAEGAFAIRDAVLGGIGRSVAHVTTSSGRDFLVRPGPTEALISYPAGSRPVVEIEGGRMQFDGHLASTPAFSEIETAWVFDWNGQVVEPISPTPRLNQPFTTSIPGGVWHCLGIWTQHRDGGTGGCWWPRGGCICHHCTIEDQQAGICIETVWTQDDEPPLACGCDPQPPPPDPRGPPDSGRVPLPVDELHDPPPPNRPSSEPPDPYRGDRIPPGSGTPIPPDAWSVPVDAWFPVPDGGTGGPS